MTTKRTKPASAFEDYDIFLLLLVSLYIYTENLGTIWAPFTEKAPQTQAIKETPRTRKNIEFMWVSGVF